MARKQILNPPVSFIDDASMRGLFHHNYQVFDIMNGSGSYQAGYNSEQLAIDQVSGSGPIYDIYLVYEDAHINSGIKLVQVGDNLLVSETDHTELPLPETPTICWYRYYIQEILDTPTHESGYFRVSYVEDTCTLFGDQSPDQLCYGSVGYGGYGGTCDDTRIAVYRELNIPFTVID